MDSRSCLLLLVLASVSSANSIPINETHQTVPPVEAAARDHNAAFGDFPVDESGVRINCDNQRDCLDSVLGEFSDCKGSTCYCVPTAHQSSTSKKCLPRRGMGEGCEEDQQCEELGSAACNNHLCSCIPGALVLDDKCWNKKNIGDACSTDEECKVTTKDAKCKDNTCTCRDGMVTHSDGQHCLKGADKVGDPCEETSQCTWELGGATCHNRKCECLDDHHTKNHACLKNLYLGQQCKGVEGECFLPDSFGSTQIVCKDTCQCIDGLTESEDKKHCLKPGQKDPGTGGAASVYPFMASFLLVITALMLTS